MPDHAGQLGRNIDPLRPDTLADFGGQPQLARELGTILAAARTRGQVPGHVLLAGPPGLGKTTLAHIIAKDMNLPMIATSGPAITKPGDLASLLAGVDAPSVVFIDEIHAIGRATEEVLYPAMEDGVLEVLIGGEGTPVSAVRVPLPPFTLVGATTQVGMLSAPLRDRFGFIGRLQPYAADDLAHIVARNAQLLDLPLDADAAGAVASRSRGTPRVANRLLGLVRDHVDAAGQRPSRIDAERAQAALDDFGIDRLGLDRLARDMLTRLCADFAGGPVGLTTLAAAVGEAPRTLEEVWEPYMMRAGLLARTPRGRVATTAAFTHLDIPIPAGAALAALAGVEAPTLPGFARTWNAPCEVDDCNELAQLCDCGAAHCPVHPHIG